MLPHLVGRNATRYAILTRHALSHSDQSISAARLVTSLATAPAAAATAMAVVSVDVVATAAAITMPAAKPATPAVATVT